MSNRRNRPVNRWGCKPDGDVCVLHDEPLTCRHGCDYVGAHSCKDRMEQFAAAQQAKGEKGAA